MIQQVALSSSRQGRTDIQDVDAKALLSHERSVCITGSSGSCCGSEGSREVVTGEQFTEDTWVGSY